MIDIKKLKEKYSDEEMKIIKIAVVLITIGIIMTSYWIGHTVGYRHGLEDEYKKCQEQFNEYINSTVKN